MQTLLISYHCTHVTIHLGPRSRYLGTEVPSEAGMCRIILHSPLPWVGDFHIWGPGVRPNPTLYRTRPNPGTPSQTLPDPARSQRLNLKHDDPLSNFAFNCNMRHYAEELVWQGPIPTGTSNITQADVAAGPFIITLVILLTHLTAFSRNQLCCIYICSRMMLTSKLEFCHLENR